jgi:2'-5' RNA ligase
MIEAKNNKELIKLQKEIKIKFSKYGKHISKEYEKFENNFKPHITIARYLNLKQLKIAKKEIQKDLFCEALIEKLVLTTVENDLFEEWSNPKNKLSYSLKK